MYFKTYRDYIPDITERSRSWRCPKCGCLVGEEDYGYPSYGDLCYDCFTEEENDKEEEKNG